MFYDTERFFYTVSCVLIAIFAVLTLVIKANVAIEFKGGTIITYTYEGDIDTNEVASTVKDSIDETAIVTTGTNFASDDTTVKLQFASKVSQRTEAEHA